MSKLIFEQADKCDFEELCGLYERVIERVSGGPEDPIWDRSIHPSDSDLRQAIAKGSLLVLRENDPEGETRIVGSLVLDHDVASGYNQVPWKVQALPEQVGIIHLLAVDPCKGRQGFGLTMLQRTIVYARQSGLKALRLDVLPRIVSARSLYERVGFEALGTFALNYPDPRVREFVLYELGL